MGNSASKGGQAVGKTLSRAGAAKRQYPSSPSPSLLLNQAAAAPAAPSPPTNPPPASRQSPPPHQPSSGDSITTTTSSSFVDLDARDPQFASSLSRLGPVRRRAPQAQNTGPQSSTQLSDDYSPPTGLHVFPSRNPTVNPAIAIVNARDRIARKFEQESEDLGSSAFTGRTLLSAREIRDVIAAQAHGRVGDDNSVIEKQFHLQRGVLTHILSAGAVKNV